MSFKMILIIFFILFLINKLINKLIKLSKEAKSETKDKLNISIKKDFQTLIIKYLESRGYFNISEPKDNLVTVYNEEEVILVAYKKTKKLEEEISSKDIITFIASMNLKSIKKGLFLTNGIISNDLKEVIRNKFKEDIQLEIVEGMPLTVELKKIKLKQLGANI